MPEILWLKPLGNYPILLIKGKINQARITFERLSYYLSIARYFSLIQPLETKSLLLSKDYTKIIYLKIRHKSVS